MIQSVAKEAGGGFDGRRRDHVADVSGGHRRLVRQPEADGRLQDLCRCRQSRAGRRASCSTRPTRKPAPHKLMAAFHQAFPKIKTSYRAPAGRRALRQGDGRAPGQVLSGRCHADLPIMGFVLDLQKRNGYMSYVSPEMAAYKPEYKSKPEGYWTWGAIDHGGHRLQPKTVPADRGAEELEGRARPEMGRTRSASRSRTPVSQHETWYELKRLYGDDYCKKFAELKPRAFDSYVQQYDRMVNRPGQDHPHRAVFRLSGIQGEPASLSPCGDAAWTSIASCSRANRPRRLRPGSRCARPLPTGRAARSAIASPPLARRCHRPRLAA